MAHLYTYSCIDKILYIKNIDETVVFPPIHMAVFFLMFLMGIIHQELYHYLQDRVFISFDISKVYIISSRTSQYSPALHSFFNKEKTSA